MPQKRQSKMNISSEEDDDEDVDTIEDSQSPAHSKAPNPRVSVSAEVFGMFNKQEEFVPRVIQKSQESKDRITERLLKSFMFSALDDKERHIIVNAMEEKKFAPGEYIIKQGEDGDNLYVIDKGELDCYKKFKADEDEKFLKTYVPGEAFGELALLYNAPRAATIKVKTEAILFALDRATFNSIVKEATVKRRQQYDVVLKHIDLLSSMDDYERIHVCDGIKEQRFKAGEYIIQEGDPGDKFYMIEEGELVATKIVEENSEPVQVYSYKPGDYFGELALISNVPRQASVVAKTDGKLVYLDSLSFKRLLGPIEDILMRNQSRYEKYLKENI